jgi:anti-anti-sigma factor
MARPDVGGNAFIVALDGILDVYRAAEVRRKLRTASRERRVVVDLTRVRVISAAVLTELIRAYKERTTQGLEPARLVVGTDAVRRVLDLTGLAGIWPIYPTLAAACMP